MPSITTGAPWGATKEEWSHFANHLGLAAELLPVVSDPSATISKLSKMQALGKTPSRYNSNDEAVGMPKWTAQQTTERQWKTWATDSRLGICLQTRRIRAIDIDIGDPVAAQRVLDLIELTLGTLPRRMRHASGKCLLAFDMPGDFAKRVIRTPDGIIEFLATGQQFIAVGTHTSGARYEWVDGDGVLALPAEFPEITPAEFDGAWKGLSALGSSMADRRGVVPAVPRSSDDSFNDAVVPWLRENDWVREFDTDGRVHIRCPFEEEHTSDSGPSATTYFPRGVGGFEQGHFRCLHAHCTGRTDGDFLEALGVVSSEFELVVASEGAATDGSTLGGAPDASWPVFRRDKAGGIDSTATNAQKAIMSYAFCKCRLGYDAFKDQTMIGWAQEGGDTWRPIRDTDYHTMRVELEGRGFKKVGVEVIRGAMAKVAELNQFDSAVQWARSLVWDRVPRVERFLTEYMGAGRTEYARAVSLYLWTALAGRCVEPGVKVDMVPVFIGKQGTGKTSMVEALAPEEGAFVEIDLGKDDEKLARSMRGKMIGEIAELRGLQGRDSESIKAWLTRRHEEWVPKFKEFSTRFARRLVFIGTGNKPEFLDDETGERRWLPVVTPAADLERVRADRDQLWAEGVVLFDQGGVQWREAQTLAVEHHKAFKVTDTWDDVVLDWLRRDEMDGLDGEPRGRGFIRTLSVLTSALSMNQHQIAKKDEMRCARVLSHLGFEKEQRWVDGHNVKVWVAGEASEFWTLA